MMAEVADPWTMMMMKVSKSLFGCRRVAIVEGRTGIRWVYDVNYVWKDGILLTICDNMLQRQMKRGSVYGSLHALLISLHMVSQR